MAIKATFTADFSSFQAAVQKADIQLRDFQADAGKVTTSLTGMSNALSGKKMISDATLMAEAVNRIGGVSKLTESELQRLSGQAREAAEKMQKVGIGVPANLQAIADAGKVAGTSTESLGVSFTKLVGSFITAQAIIGAVKTAYRAFTGAIIDSVQAAGDAEKAHVQIVAALRAQGTAIPSVISAYGGYADALQKTTIYQDDAIEGAQALLVQIGNVMPRDMKKALDATTELASGLGIDLTTAATMVAKAAEGNVLALRKIGVETTDVGGKQKEFGGILDSITDKFGGQAVAIAGTYSGRLQQLGNTWNNVQESVGRVITQNATLLRAFDLLNQSLSTNTGELNQNKTANDLVAAAVIGSVKAFSIFLQALDLAQTAYAGLRITSNSVAQAFLSVGIAATTAATAFIQASKYLNPVIWLAAKGSLADLANTTDTLKSAVALLNIDSEKAAQRSADWGNALQGVKSKADAFTTELEKTKGQTKQLKDATDSATDAWNRETRALQNTKVAAGDTAKSLTDSVTSLRGFRAEGVAAAQAVALGMKGNISVLVDLGIAIGSIQSQWKTLAGNIKQIDLSQAVAQLPKVLDAGVYQQFFLRLANDAGNGGLKAGISFKGEFRNALGDLSSTMMRAFEGGGGLVGAFKSLGIQLADAIVAPIMAGLNKASQMAVSLGATGASGVGASVGGTGAAMVGGSAAAIGGAALATTSLGAAAAGSIAASVALGAATMGIGLAAVGAYYGLKKLFGGDGVIKDVNKTRQAFVDAAGGLAQLDAYAHETGQTLDKFLDARNPQEYATAVNKLTGAFQRHSAAVAGAGRFGPSSADLQHMAQEAHDVFDYMEKSGLYTAEQLTEAYAAFQQAMAKAGNEAAVQWVAANTLNSKAFTDAEKGLTDLIGQRNSLVQSIASEAPEEVMGVIEAQQRAQLAVLNEQIVDKADAYAQLARDTGREMAEAITRALREIRIDPIHIQTIVDSPGVEAPEGVDGASTGGIVGDTGIQHFARGGKVLPFRPRGGDTVPAMLTPGEMVLTRSQQKAVGSLMGGGGNVVDLARLEQRIDSMSRTMADIGRRQPYETARAVRDALRKPGSGKR